MVDAEEQALENQQDPPQIRGIGEFFHNNIQLGMVRTYFDNPPILPLPEKDMWMAPNFFTKLNTRVGPSLRSQQVGCAFLRPSYRPQPITVGPSNCFIRPFLSSCLAHMIGLPHSQSKIKPRLKMHVATCPLK